MQLKASDVLEARRTVAAQAETIWIDGLMPAASSSFFTLRKCRPCCFASAKSETYSRSKRSTSSAGTMTVGQRFTGLTTVMAFR
jgi:hypothetical protein